MDEIKIICTEKEDTAAKKTKLEERICSKGVKRVGG
jgi:hypothetical protein